MVQRQKILVVDDNPVSLKLNVLLLYAVDADIVTAGSGEEAVRIAHNEKIDLILMDVNMPDMDGFDAVKFIKSEEKNKYIPVIFITAFYHDELKIIEGLDIGALDYICKPVSRGILITKVNNLLELQRNRKGLELAQNKLVRTIEELQKRNIEQEKAEEKIKLLLREKELMLKEVHHRIKNNMSAVMGILTLHSYSLQDPIAISALDDATSRIGSICNLYDKLYRSDNFNEVSMKTYIGQLVDEIMDNFSKNKKIEIKKEIDEFNINAKITFSLGIILNELLTNAVKYAFVGRDEGEILISGTLKENSAIVTIKDNGIGMPESINIGSSSGFGMSLIEMLVEQIKGTVQIERQNGTKFTLEFPVQG